MTGVLEMKTFELTETGKYGGMETGSIPRGWKRSLVLLHLWLLQSANPNNPTGMGPRVIRHMLFL